MKIGIDSSAYQVTADGLSRMKRHGYDCIDYQRFTGTSDNVFSLSLPEFERSVLQHAEMIRAAGLEISQVHGPWRYPPRDATLEDRAERFETMSKALYGTRLLGCKYMVIHPMMPYGRGKPDDPDRFFEINFDHYSRLCEVARREGVIICLENMPMPELPLATPTQILNFVKEINHPNMRVCLDTGHCAVCGVSPADALREAGTEYIRVMHVHDNDGRGDQHRLPFFGVINWEDFRLALHEIGYEGTVSLECEAPSKLPAASKETFEIALAQTVKYLTQL